MIASSVGGGRRIEGASGKNGADLFEAFVFSFGHFKKQKHPKDGDENDERDEDEALQSTRQIPWGNQSKGRMNGRRGKVGPKRGLTRVGLKLFLAGDN